MGISLAVTAFDDSCFITLHFQELHSGAEVERFWKNGTCSFAEQQKRKGMTRVHLRSSEAVLQIKEEKIPALYLWCEF